MTPTTSMAPHRRARLRFWLASSALTSVSLTLCCAPALAQQEVSPRIEPLPAIVVSPTPTPPPAARPRAAATTRPAAQARQAAPQRTESPPAPAVNPAPVVVSPTAIPTPETQIASSVTVITAQELEQTQRRTGPEALSTVPGLHIVQGGGPGALTSVFMRGTNPNHTKFLIDGVDVSDPSNVARTYDLGQLLTSDVERIEVLRGPQSGLYGADALGGVISIITKQGSGPPKVFGTLEGGSFGTFNQYAGFSGSQDRFNYAFNVAHFRATDVPVTPLELLPPGQRRINDFYDNVTLSTKLGVDLNENFAVNFVARYTDTLLRFTGDDFSQFPSPPAAAQSTQMLRQFFTRGEAVWAAPGGSFVNRFSVAYTDHWSWNKSPDTAFGAAIPVTNAGDRVKTEWRGDWTISPGNIVLFGLQHELETFQTDTTANQNNNRAAYIELQSNPFPNFFVAANARFDDNDRFGSVATWRVAPAYIVPGTETKLKASVGTAFKAPTLAQLYADFPDFNFFANPNLRPEESLGYDVGFEQPLLGNRIRFGATYFHNDITNLIAPNASFTTNINIGAATTYGVEAFAAVAITDRIKLRADYTYTEAFDATTDLQLLRRPRHKASLTAGWNPWDELALAGTILHVGDWIDGNRNFTIPRLTAPGYTIVNLAGSYTLNQYAKVFARVDNLFDLRYQEPTGFLRPGLGVFGGVRLTN